MAVGVRRGHHRLTDRLTTLDEIRSAVDLGAVREFDYHDTGPNHHSEHAVWARTTREWGERVLLLPSPRAGAEPPSPVRPAVLP